jgi:hypothetical protein
MTQYVAYHGVTAQQHQARVDSLAPQGYRLVSINVAGDPGDARYAAIWFLRAGADWQALHGLNATQYQQRFDAFVAQGYTPALVSATGSFQTAIFASVFERGKSGAWFARHGLNWDPNAAQGSINFENQRALNEGFIPVSLAAYGTPDDQRFAGVWVRNDQPIPWSWWWADPTTYQRFFTAEVHAGTRVSCVSVASSQWILSVFRDEPIGEWWARHAMTAQDYQHEFDVRTSQGLEPLIVQAGGAGPNTRYASLFVKDDHPQVRHWTVSGASFAGMADFDSAIRQFMSVHAIRALSFAVARKGVLLAQRAFTWAEDTYPITRPQTVMRMASVTKILTCAAVDRLVKDGSLSLDAPAFGFLGITQALLSSQTPDPDIDKVTVGQLATRRSGLQRDFGLDLRGIARRISSTHPVWPARDVLVRYIYGEPLIARPGAVDSYSNSAFTVLTSIVERASGRPYLDFVRVAVLSPLSINDVSLSATAFDARKPGEVATYDHPGIGPSQVDMADDAVAPNGTVNLTNVYSHIPHFDAEWPPLFRAAPACRGCSEPANG